MGNTAINQEKQEQQKKILEKYCKDWKIFIDTCSLLHSSSDDFWMNIIPLLHQYQNSIFIPSRCVEEIKKHSKNKNNTELAQNAKECLIKLKGLVEAGYVEIRGEPTDNFTDNVFQVVFTKFRMKYKLLLITQDNNLAKDILNLNNSRSVKANEVKVNRINKYGLLREFYWKDSEENTDLIKTSKKLEKKEIKIGEDEMFRVCSQVTNISDTKLRVSEMPIEGSNVLTSKGSIKLTKELGSGGEAIVYLTNTPYVAKIYKNDNITKRKYEKIKLMLSKNINCSGICYPVEIIYNSKNEFVGYLMPQAKGQELQKSVFGPKPLFLKKFPDWKKRDTVELCVTILGKIKYLHDRNIIMGDINPANILVVSPKEVYFVDTDSYQVEDFPCPVGTNNYTAPEIQRKHFSDFLRTRGNENFAVATLLFMIMLPGKPPYSQQGGEDPISNIIKMDFSYPFGDNSNKKHRMVLDMYPLYWTTSKEGIFMRYSYEFKLMCVELYHSGSYPDIPEGLNPDTLKSHIRKWSRLVDLHGPEVLRHKVFNRVWTPEEKLELVSKVIAGIPRTKVAIEAGINPGMLYQWVHKYKLQGYNGLVESKKGRPTKEPRMKKSTNPLPLTESEREELIRLRAENEYIKAENEVIKKRIALRQEKWAAQLKAKKQQSSKNSEKKDTN